MMFIISMSPQPIALANITAGITLPLIGMPRTAITMIEPWRR
jgi:hypothetical protein